MLLNLLGQKYQFFYLGTAKWMVRFFFAHINGFLTGILVVVFVRRCGSGEPR